MLCRRFYTDHVTEIDAPHPGAIMRRPRETRFLTGSVGADREQKNGAPVGITTKMERKQVWRLTSNDRLQKTQKHREEKVGG